ncbi:MAG: sulfatase-like hydrolase/transferase, partial [Polyangia bacterium]
MVSRLALAGTLAGLVAALLDYALAYSGLAAFLPHGSARLLVFLVGLYGASGLCVGALVGALLAALELGDVGVALGVHTRPGARVAAYAALGLPLLVGVGALLRPIVESYLVFFHNHMLIAAVTGATAAGLTVLALILVLLLAGPLSSLLRFGPRVHPQLSAPVFVLPALVVALYAGAGLVALDVMYLFGRPRMTSLGRSMNVALAAPWCLAGGIVVGALLYYLLRRVRVPATAPWVIVATLLTLTIPIFVGAAAAWPVVKQLDRAPFMIGGVLLIVLVVAGTYLRGRAWIAIAAFVVCTALTLGLGKSAPVRKAASLAALAPPLVHAIQLASDLDRDGYSSLLGGGDCNDLDATVHPGAFDWPDDGIDEDCNGHQATLAERMAKTYAPVPEAVPQRPNVILLTLDALRSDHVSSYGYKRKTTPRLDELAETGIRFENAWSHAPSTRYSVPAILSGRYPSTIAVNPDPRVHWPPLVLPENRMLAEMLHDLGYRTGATLSYHYFERGWGLDQGFDDYDYHLFTLHSAGGDPAATSGSSSRQLADLDIEWLKAHKDAPFFLWSHFYDTHFRFEPHPDLPETNFGSDEEALYDGEIRYADHHIGRVLDTLRELGLWDKTIVIITSDHGDGFGEHGIPQSKRHGYHLYRTETKVPVLMHVPGLAPRVVMTPIGHVDLIPTLLNLLRRSVGDEPQLAGESLLA